MSFFRTVLKQNYQHMYHTFFSLLLIDSPAGLCAVIGCRVSRLSVLVAECGSEGQCGKLHQNSIRGGKGQGHCNTLRPGHPGKKNL